MTESALMLILLGVISVSLTALTVTILLTARDFRLTLHRVNAILPRADEALDEAHRSLRLIRRCLTRVHETTRHVEGFVHEACDTASEAMAQLNRLKGRAEHFWVEHFGNGARAESRQHHRRR